MKQEDLELMCNECRLLVFLENEPQSNKYNQVILSPEQFKIISKNTGRKVESDVELKDGFEMYETKLSDDDYILPDLQSISL
jgi:hypothetical protein